MKLSEQWLREWIPLKVSTEQLLQDLTALGLEVEGCEPQGQDHVIEVAITPNRGDCLSIEGIARDLSAFYQIPPAQRMNPEVVIKSLKKPTIKLEASKACPHYVGRIIEKIDPTCKTPQSILARLEAAGLRSVSPVVDVTNYVMLEMGQPMHAFDLEQTGDHLKVRFAQPQETITLLNESKLNLDPAMLVIADQNKPIALAGVMGGLASSVTEKTHSILLESAFFDPISIRVSAHRAGLSTDSSYRFERGVGFRAQQLCAIHRATELLLAIVGGIAGPITTAVAKQSLPTRAPVILNKQTVKTILGFELSPTEITAILKRLNMKVSSYQDGWQVVPPAYRFDMAIEMDLVEEIARLYGYQQIPDKRPRLPADVRVKPKQTAVLDLKKTLVARGYHEAITYSFVSEKIMHAFLPDQPLYALKNPISSELGVMRASLMPGLVEAVLYNLNRQQTRVRLFESGLQFCLNAADAKAPLKQIPILAGAACGSVWPKCWGNSKRSVDFYDVKGDLAQLLQQVGLLEQVVFKAQVHPSLHPAQTAAIVWQDQVIGWLGALHPRLMQLLDLSVPIYLFELEEKHIHSNTLPQFKPLSKWPAISRDLAFVLDSNVLACELNSAILDCVGEWLVDLKLFDVYTGERIGANKKSIALELWLQHQTRTLVDEEVNTLIEKVVKTLKTQFGAALRE